MPIYTYLVFSCELLVLVAVVLVYHVDVLQRGMTIIAQAGKHHFCDGLLILSWLGNHMKTTS